MPTLGICPGCQVMNVHRRGTLHQHLPDVSRESPLQHSRAGDRTNGHAIALRPGSAVAIDFVPHQTQPSVGHVANMHFIAALAHNHHPIEFAEKPDPDGSGPQNVVFKNPIRPEDGYFTLPTDPGLGLELDEEELRKRLVEWK